MDDLQHTRSHRPPDAGDGVSRFELRGGSLIAVVVALALTTLVTLGTVLDGVGGLLAAVDEADRGRSVSARYERKLRGLRMELERLRSAESVARARLATRVRKLANRSDWLKVSEEAIGRDGTALAGLALRGASGPVKPTTRCWSPSRSRCAGRNSGNWAISSVLANGWRHGRESWRRS